jgi:pimeloyl-ACP methyl ester carboxylesterase
MKVVLLHAWPLDERMWDPYVGALTSVGHEHVAPRLYGRGPSIDAWAGQLLSEIEGQLVAVGASMGGYCALALARRSPERVLGLVLAGSRAGADTDERRRFRDEQIRLLREEGVPPEHDAGVPAEELAVAQEAMRDRPGASGVVSSFGGPLLVGHGDRDEVVPAAEARAIADAALLGSFELFPGAGHFVSIDAEERFRAVLLEFLEQWT